MSDLVQMPAIPDPMDADEAWDNAKARAFLRAVAKKGKDLTDEEAEAIDEVLLRGAKG